MLKLSSNKYYDFFSCNIPFSSFFSTTYSKYSDSFLKIFSLYSQYWRIFFCPNSDVNVLFWKTEVSLQHTFTVHTVEVTGRASKQQNRPRNATYSKRHQTAVFNSVSGGFFWSIKSSSTVSFLKQDFFHRSVWKSWHLMLRSFVHILRSNKTWRPRYVHLTSC